MQFDPGLIDAFRNILPGLGDFFLLITQFGSEIFFIGLLLIGYWVVNKRESIHTTYLLLVAVLSNYWLKYFIANNRPPSSYWYANTDPPNYSTPSGHSQYSASLFGWFAIRLKTWWMYLIGSIMTLLIGLSRLYLGVHYLEDIVLGWILGILTVFIFCKLERPVREYLTHYTIEYKLLALFVIGFLLTLLAAILPEPPNDNFGPIGGLTMGLALGLILENRFVGFSTDAPEGKRWKLVLRVLIGIILVFAIMIGLSPLLPSEIMFLRMVRYLLTAIMGVFIWPLIFNKINL